MLIQEINSHDLFFFVHSTHDFYTLEKKGMYHNNILLCLTQKVEFFCTISYEPPELNQSKNKNSAVSDYKEEKEFKNRIVNLWLTHWTNCHSMINDWSVTSFNSSTNSAVTLLGIEMNIKWTYYKIKNFVSKKKSKLSLYKNCRHF